MIGEKVVPLPLLETNKILTIKNKKIWKKKNGCHTQLSSEY